MVSREVQHGPSGPGPAVAGGRRRGLAVVARPGRRRRLYTGSNNSVISFGHHRRLQREDARWIPNNVTGLNDILASPGGTFQLANPVVGNNRVGRPGGLRSRGLAFLDWTGGTRPAERRPFGTGSAAIYGPAATFALTDATPGGGGTASYGIETWNSSYTQTTAYNGTFGTFLSIGGNVAARELIGRRRRPDRGLCHFGRGHDPVCLRAAHPGGRQPRRGRLTPSSPSARSMPSRVRISS